MLHQKDFLLYLKHENFKLDFNIEKIRGDVGQNQPVSDIDSRVETWRTAVRVPLTQTSKGTALYGHKKPQLKDVFLHTCP